ncbi:uncharacterized protein LOC132700259 [Cylas formicarius]|uniref:uncharacterized protein LOC132700259 n=1 Tax=Cylas formicarius TaxID=197179 RepID=UPI002958B7D9|nr:uncharacterized protein LOC132700259 [Cylas formicarius]
MSENILRGYVDVKISSRSKRGLTPWKAWKRQWCEIKRLDDIENGVELKLKSSADGNPLNCLRVPRSATLCRTDSRTKQYAFGVFNLTKSKKPLLFLSGCSESDSQEWMLSIRKMLSIASYIPVGDSNFHVSLVDNKHSRAAGLLGLFGVLGVSPQGIAVCDPCTGEPKITWKWYQFHQFHMQASLRQLDDKKIVVVHTSGDFPAGPGQLHLYCGDGPRLLQYLVSRGTGPGLVSAKRFSLSEGDLCLGGRCCPTGSPHCIRSQSESDDSGLPISSVSEDLECGAQLGVSMIAKTPGGSETEDSFVDLTEEPCASRMVRNESEVSLSSGVYEEIPDFDEWDRPATPVCHIYENPAELVFGDKIGRLFSPPPPLPPRTMTLGRPISRWAEFKTRCNTLPAKDLLKVSQRFMADSEYVVMSPARSVVEGVYVPMFKANAVESYYISMGGGAGNT